MAEKTAVKKRNSVIPRTKPLLIVPKRKTFASLNKWIKETKHSYQVTRKDVCYIYRNIIFAKTYGELKDIMENEEKRDGYPVIVLAVIAGVLGDIARGNIVNLTRMLQFVFPDAMRNIDPDVFANEAGRGGYDEIQEMENALKRLEGDDSILIVDKLLMAEDTKTRIIK